MEDKKKQEEVKINPKKEAKSQAKRTKLLLKRYNRWHGKHYEMANFQEPVLFLMRRTGAIEFREKATQGLMEFTHTDGEKRYIRLDPKKIHIFDYGTKKVRCYIVHEDNPFPLPIDALMDSQNFTNNTDLTVNNAGNFKAKQIREQANLIKWLLFGIAAVIGAYFLGKMLLPAETIVEVTKPVGQAVVQNISVIG